MSRTSEAASEWTLEDRASARSQLVAVRTERLLKITAAIADAVSSDQVFEALVDHVAEAVNASSAALWLVDEQKHTAHLVRARGYTAASARSLDDLPLDLAPSVPFLDSIRRAQPIWLASQAALLEQYPHLIASTTKGRSYRISCLPLMVQGEVVGTLALTIESAQPGTDDERDFLLLVARYASQAVERLRLYEAEHKSRARAEQLVAHLEETIRLNELFAGALAHDLRTPLQSIMSAAQLLLMRRASEAELAAPQAGAASTAATGKPLSRILGSGHRMMTMIDQLLDFTRARSGGGIGIKPQETNLKDVCAQASDEIELAHPEWKISCKSSGDLSGVWDPDRLLRVISNLVANAGQHGLAGRPIAVELDGTQADQVCIHVRNEGAILAALLPHLFEPFRSTGQRRDRSRGLGLGLFIVREIVRAHAGNIEVSSSDVQGTTFSVRLPRRPASATGK